MKYLTLLIKPASSKCQLRCKYCFYFDEAASRSIKDFGIMNAEVQEKLIAKTMDHFQEPVTITYMFQGGEPTLAGIQWYESFLAKVKKHQKSYHVIHYAIQTNGILLDASWAELLAKNHFLVGISIDGDIKDHNRYRQDANGMPAFTKVIANYHLLKKMNVEVNVLSVLSESLAQHPDRYYRFLQHEDIMWVQLIPCLAPLHETSAYALTPESYASFFCRLFNLWMDEVQNGKIRSISLFDDILAVLQGQMPSQCGRLGYCQAQYVVEADGSVYPCDFYVLDQWKCGSFADNTLAEIAESQLRRVFESRSIPTEKLCQQCKWLHKCHGGCIRQRHTIMNESFCGHQVLLNHIEQKLLTLK